ncbi:hypothetical protein VR41_12790 [Streptomyces sp. NRRL B-1568]|nr:hypothetical protein VR41_12790 [Streptomyces sp. NRRL B-1568]
MTVGDFPAHWRAPEQQLFADAQAGRETSLGSGDSSAGGCWGDERTIRAEVLRALLTSPRLAPRIVRLRLRGARIDGSLDFEAATLNATLELTGCHFAEVVNLKQTTAPAIYLNECTIAGVQAAQLHTLNSLTLINTNCAFANLPRARIDGLLSLQGSTFPDGRRSAYALELNDISVGSDAILDKIVVSGPVNLVGAKISGQLDLSGAQLDHNGGAWSLKAHYVDTKEDVVFEQAQIKGTVDFTGSTIGGSLRLNRAHFHRPGKEPALDLARVKIKQNMWCQDGCTVEGRVMLADAKIYGSLMASGGSFVNPSDTAIDATGLEVGRDVVFSKEAASQDADRSSFRAQGRVILMDAEISGTLDCRGGSISNPYPEEEALNLRGTKVTRNLRLSDGFTVFGKVVLVGAEIGGRAIWNNGAFKNPEREAIAARQLRVRESLLIREQFLADGSVDLSGATVGGRVVVNGGVHCSGQNALILDRFTAKQDVEVSELVVKGSLCMRSARVASDLKFRHPNLSQGKNDLALSLEGTAIKGTLELISTSPVDGVVELGRVKAQSLKDTPNFWPLNKKAQLDGFGYEMLSNLTTRDVRTRIDWLKDRSAYSSQNYQQLASVYRASGDNGHARRVLYAGQRNRPRSHWWEKVWSWLLRVTIGYGYYPALVLCTLFAFELLGWAYFCHHRGDLKPASALKSAYADNVTNARKHFQPLLYTLDLLLPVVSLGQRGLWIPQGPTSWVVTGLTIVGWVLGGILAYGLGSAYQQRNV